MAEAGPGRRPGFPRTIDLRDVSYGERHKPTLPYGRFSYMGRLKNTKSLYGLPRAKFGYPGSFRKTSRTSVNSTGVANCYGPVLLCYAQNISHTSELIMCATTTQWGMGVGEIGPMSPWGDFRADIVAVLAVPGHPSRPLNRLW